MSNNEYIEDTDQAYQALLDAFTHPDSNPSTTNQQHTTPSWSFSMADPGQYAPYGPPLTPPLNPATGANAIPAQYPLDSSSSSMGWNMVPPSSLSMSPPPPPRPRHAAIPPATPAAQSHLQIRTPLFHPDNHLSPTPADGVNGPGPTFRDPFASQYNRPLDGPLYPYRRAAPKPHITVAVDPETGLVHFARGHLLRTLTIDRVVRLELDKDYPISGMHPVTLEMLEDRARDGMRRTDPPEIGALGRGIVAQVRLDGGLWVGHGRVQGVGPLVLGIVEEVEEDRREVRRGGRER
ncbi:hypothetical protein BDW74DRAFT_180378 [Aspergillus multicolor]|uniref:uncharacterized protein n=1 Tax=Aspergillus multicolor TaxID=41759 RepID=UPI003CCDCEEC